MFAQYKLTLSHGRSSRKNAFLGKGSNLGTK